MKFARVILVPLVLSSIVALAPASAAAAAPDATDLGPTPAAQTVSASLVLKVKHPEILEGFVALTQEPLLPFYHRFLSLHDFVASFSPTSHDIATITSY